MSTIFLPEWHKQSAVIITWPHKHSDWLPWLATLDPIFVQIASCIAKRQNVIINCFDAAHKQHIETLLTTANANTAQIYLYLVPTNDTWVRDYGPLSVEKNGLLQLLNFQFNAWGNKYVHDKDDRVNIRLQEQGAFGNRMLETVNLVLEGGSVETDGHGTLLTTERCLLAKTRNSHLYSQQLDFRLGASRNEQRSVQIVHEHVSKACNNAESSSAKSISREQIKAALQRTLGIQRILWLQHGYLAGDDTDSHIDMLARFTDPHTICYVSCNDPHDEHYEALGMMEQELQTFTDYQGKPYRLVSLPFPHAIYNDDKKRLPASYANFLIINGAVLLPIYNDPADEQAINCLKKCFPNREIIPILSNTLIQQYGSLHCAMMQIAAEVTS